MLVLAVGFVRFLLFLETKLCVVLCAGLTLCRAHESLPLSSHFLVFLVLFPLPSSSPLALFFRSLDTCGFIRSGLIRPVRVQCYSCEIVITAVLCFFCFYLLEVWELDVEVQGSIAGLIHLDMTYKNSGSC